MEYVAAIVTGILTCIGTIAAAWIALRGKLAQTSANSQDALFTQLIAETASLRDVISERDKTIIELQAEITKLRNEVGELRTEIEKYESTRMPGDAPHILEQIMNIMPYPAWLHEVGANKWYLNDAYSERFRVNRKDFWTPVNIWRFDPSEAAAEYVAADMAVIESNIARYSVEHVSDAIMEAVSNDNPPREWDIVKVPIRAGGRNYVFGIATRSREPDSIMKAMKKKAAR